MAWDQHGSRRYYTRSHKKAGKVTREYFGNGAEAKLLRITWQRRVGSVVVAGFFVLILALCLARTWLAAAISSIMKYIFATSIVSGTAQIGVVTRSDVPRTAGEDQRLSRPDGATCLRRLRLRGRADVPEGLRRSSHVWSGRRRIDSSTPIRGRTKLLADELEHRLGRGVVRTDS
jgi:hypothetical protein